MGFYGNILTIDSKTQEQLQGIEQKISGLSESYKNQNFIFDGNNQELIGNSEPNISAADFETRLSNLETFAEQITEIIGELYTELHLVHNLLITSQELAEWEAKE